MPTVLALVTLAGVEPDDASRQELTFAAKLAAPERLHAVVIGPGPFDDRLADLGGFGVDIVHLAEHPELRSFAPDAWARILVDLAADLDASFVVGPGSDIGTDVLARVAARMGVPFAANVTAASVGEATSITRLRWAGSLLEDARILVRPSVISVAPFAVAAVVQAGAASIARFTPELDPIDLVVRVRAMIPAPPGGVALADARVVVSGGRGVGDKGGFAPLEELASLLGAALGSTRAVTLAGWRPHTDQIGQTGTRIAPDVYIACGVSGAMQHMIGCKGAKLIIAINTDRDAPIMHRADYSVVGRLADVVPAITAELRRLRAAPSDA